MTDDEKTTDFLGEKGNDSEGFQHPDDLTGLSHVLRTPLHGVVGMLELLEATELTERQKTFLDAAQSSAAELEKALDGLSSVQHELKHDIAAEEEIQFRDRSFEPALPLVTEYSPREARSALRILVADDHPIHRTIISTALKRRGFEVLSVTNGKDALLAIEYSTCDLVLMDVSMPEMDGIEATRKIRALKGGSENRVPIVGLTADASESNRLRCLHAGMDGWVTKPIKQAYLFEVIEKIIGGPRQDDHLESGEAHDAD